MTKILGISCYYHDSAAALIEDGNILSAVQEERFSRIKNDSRFPIESINYILNENNLKLSEIDHIVFYEKPFTKFSRLLETNLANVPKGFQIFKKSIPIWVKEKLFQKRELELELLKIDKLFNQDILFSDHHLSHAVSAFYPSSFEKSLILTFDAVGEYTTTSIAIGDQNQIEFKKVISYPHSIGMLYSAFTMYCGFKVNEGEYKLMGLAPYGEPKYADIIKEKLINLKEDGSFSLNMNYFGFSNSLSMINKKFENLFGQKCRKNFEQIDKFHMDIASSIQKVTEEIIINICRIYSKEFKLKNLCMAGGVALNCVANGKIAQLEIFDDIYVQPAAGDAGGALGSALAVWHIMLKNKRIIKKDSMQSSLLGPSFSNSKIKTCLDNLGAKYEELNDQELFKSVAEIINSGFLVGWFQGKTEYGPRALGNRSILADPRKIDMQKTINSKIKFREGFRPFAPAILEDHINKFFTPAVVNPFMLFVLKFKDEYILNQKEVIESEGFKKLNVKKSIFPSITHVDYSARVQSVSEKTNPTFYKLLKSFYDLTKCPMLINTSFNINNEPIVNTVVDAYKCFLTTDLDYLVCGNFILNKTKQYQ